MPPPSEKVDDRKPTEDRNRSDSGDKHDSGSQQGTQTIRSFGDIAENRIRDVNGGSGGSDNRPLSDSILGLPDRSFNWRASEHVRQADLAEGISRVRNMTFKVTDSDGQPREISGPTASRRDGTQYILDQQTGKKYLITPPAETGGQATLTPFGKYGRDREPLTVVEQKAVDGFSPRYRQPDAASAAELPRKDLPAVKPAVIPDAVTPVVHAVPRIEPAVGVPGAENNWGLPGGQRRLLGQSEEWLREHKVPEATIQLINQYQEARKTGQVTPELMRDLRQSVTEYRAEQWKQARETFQQNNPPNQNGENPAFRMQPPMNKEQFDQFRRQFEQNPQAAMEALRQMQAQAREQRQDQMPVRPEQAQQQQQQQQFREQFDKLRQLSPEQVAQIMQDRARQMTEIKPGQMDPSQKPMDAALRDLLSDRNNRPALIELLKELQHGRLPNDAALQNNRSLQDIMKALGPEALTDLRKVLSHQDGTMLGGKPGDGNKIDLLALSPKAREIVELLAAQSQRNLQFDQANRNPGVLAAERLLDILRMNDKTLQPAQKVPDADVSRFNILEMGRVLRELNMHNQDGKTLSLRDILGRTFEDGKERVPGQNLAIRELTLRPHTGEEVAIRALLDRLHHRDPDGAVRAELNVRAELLTNRLDGTRTDKPDLAVKADLKADGIVRGDGQKDLGAKLDAGQLPGRQERILDPDQLAQAQKELQSKLPGQAQTDKNDKLDEDLKHKIKDGKKKDDEELPVDQAAALAALAAKKRKEQDEKDKQESSQEKDKKEPERRMKYIVRPGDTLEIIATRMLRDKRLAGLIYDINADTIPVMMIDGKKVPQLRERMIIWLPTPTEAKDYRTRLMSSTDTRTQYDSAEDELAARFGKNWDGKTGGTTGGASLEDMEDSARAAYAARRKHIESLLGPLSSKSESAQPKHVVRLGETLKSVAMKHPALQDVSLWKLLAELNGLSTQTDERGTPLAKLNRGQSIVLPSAAEIEAFRQRESGGGERTKISGALELPTRICSGCKRTTFASASLCPGCGRPFEPPATTGGAEPKTRTKVVAKAPPLPAAAASPKPAQAERRTRVLAAQTAPSPAQSEFTLTKQFSESARLMTAGTASELHSGYRLQLEVLDNGSWRPLIAYEIFDGVCLRHEIDAADQRKSIRIDLPPQAAIDLANNDLETNWKSYEEAHRRT